MSARKIKNSWWIDIRHEGERYRKRSPQNSKAGAEAYEALLRHRLALGEPLEAATASQKLFRDFVPEWVENYVRTNNKPSEQRAKDVNLRLHLLPWFGAFRLNQIGPLEIERYKNAKNNAELSPKTINNHVATLIKCLRCACEWGLIASVPRMVLLKSQTPKFDHLTPIESAQLLRERSEPMWHEMILVALRTGMRHGELIGLDWSDVDFDSRQINVRQSIIRGVIGSPKNNRNRYIPMTDEVCKALEYRRKARGLMFTRPDGTALSYSIAWNAIKRHCKRAGLRHFSWHVLRHTFASQLVSAGVVVPAVQQLLGHSTIQMTMRYSHVASSLLSDAVARLATAEKNAQPNYGQPAGNADKILTEIFS